MVMFVQQNEYIVLNAAELKNCYDGKFHVVFYKKNFNLIFNFILEYG